jgi:membrane protease YdiL (CAAX protease family)
MTVLNLQFKTTRGSELLLVFIASLLPLLLFGIVPERLQGFLLTLHFTVLVASFGYVLCSQNNTAISLFMEGCSTTRLLLVMALCTGFFLCSLPFFSDTVAVEIQPTDLVFMLITAVLLAPLAEELLFRQMLLSWLVNRRGLPLPWVVMLLSLVFTLLHPVSSYLWFSYYFVISLLLFWLRIYCGPLLLCVLAHVWLNLLVAGRSVLLLAG